MLTSESINAPPLAVNNLAIWTFPLKEASPPTWRRLLKDTSERTKRPPLAVSKLAIWTFPLKEASPPTWRRRLNDTSEAMKSRFVPEMSVVKLDPPPTPPIMAEAGIEFVAKNKLPVTCRLPFMETSPPIWSRLLKETSDATTRRLFRETSPVKVAPVNAA